ncbi:retrovirus-related pol polyprotein from transposon TNT 1-94 [Tanacetum coccineum]
MARFKTVFLNGHLSEDVYMVEPERFVDPKHPNKVSKLQRSMYGLKQASRSWNKRFDVEIKKIGFTQNLDEPCVYLKASGSNVAFLILYVDDILLMGNNVTMLQEVKSWLYMVLIYGEKLEDELKVSCYADASFQTNRDDTKSQMGYVFVLNGGAVEWKSAKQSTTTISSTEAEYIAATEASMPMEMLCDNEPALAIASDPGILKGARHFQRKYHYIRELSKLKVLDDLPSLLIKVTEALNKFATAIASSLQTTGDTHVPIADQAVPQRPSLNLRGELIKNKGKEVMSHKEAEEKGSKSDSKTQVRLSGSMFEFYKNKCLKKFSFVIEQEVDLGREELADLMCINVVTNLYKAKLEYDKYCDKILNRRALGKITNYDVLLKGKGPITLKVYREDGSDETIQSFKATELELDFNKPLGEQDPIIKLNDLARKKRKHADDIHDYFRSTKRYKSLAKYEDHPSGTVLNEPSLGMILFNSHQRQDFISIEDFKDLDNEMMYIM